MSWKSNELGLSGFHTGESGRWGDKSKKKRQLTQEWISVAEQFFRVCLHSLTADRVFFEDHILQNASSTLHTDKQYNSSNPTKTVIFFPRE